MVLRKDPLVTLPPNDEEAEKIKQKHHLELRDSKRVAERAEIKAAKKAAKEASKEASK